MATDEEQQQKLADAFLSGLFKSNDHAAALMAAEGLSDQLARAISRRLENISGRQPAAAIFTGNGQPLSTFSNRISVGFEFGVFGPLVKQELNWVRKIRNHFAHEYLNTSFHNDQIKDLIQNLSRVDERSNGNPYPKHLPAYYQSKFLSCSGSLWNALRLDPAFTGDYTSRVANVLDLTEFETRPNWH